MYIMSDDGFNEYMADNLAQYDINQDIEQGFLFKKYQKKYYSENEHRLMQETSSNTWGSISEAMTSGASTQGQAGAATTQPPDNITAFNTLVSTYGTSYRIYTSTMLTRPATDSQRLDMENSLRQQQMTIQAAARNIQNGAAKVSDINTVNRLNTAIHRLKNEQNNLSVEANKYNADTMAGKIETTTLNMNSMFYHYFVYFAISIVLIAFTFNILVNPNASVLNAIYVVVALLAVYFFVRRSEL